MHKRLIHRCSSFTRISSDGRQKISHQLFRVHNSTISAMASPQENRSLTRASVHEAHQLIKPHIHLTPVLTSTTLSTLASTPQSPSALQGTPYEGCTPAHPHINLFFKCENYQRVGAFKSRGAFHALARLSDEELSRGVVTHSSGTPCLDIFCLRYYLL